ncbi:inositol monophosphatase ImpA [Gordonia araii NBRC 100433]|uniref:inositol-phosphate phosphatase n=1 Tax=Gordonia araii NBRC 100433 TaxID=1073574 RepID=G7H2P3_9ACTN|nr:inositol monophosphatase family protein [Gordonia araii]GAB10118.1 inositol monophosphatase ImpA [Gordonia araii NBRC 100433]
MSTPPAPDLPRLAETAASILDAAVPKFRAGVGAPGVVAKGEKDFATQVDLDLERFICAELTQRTGLPCHGEEFGGAPADVGLVWVVDPVDGTFNYSTGNPMTGILVGLCHDGEPLLGLTWLPLLDLRYVGYEGGGLSCNGRLADPLPPVSLRDSVVGFGAFNERARGRYPGARRIEVLAALSSRVARLRMSGSIGVDLAFTAAGVYSGAITFGRHAWDNAAGAALVRAAGGVVTDIAGNPWRVESPSVVAAAPGVHGELIDLIDSVTGQDWEVR